MGETEAEGTARSQNVVLQGPADTRTMAAAMRPGVERSRGVVESAAPACLVITPTVEQALSAAEQARIVLADDTSRVVPVSQVARARRVLASGPVSIVTGTTLDLLALRKDSAMSLGGLKALVIVGLDDVLAQGDAEALQALLGDSPTDAMRVVTIDNETPDVEAFLEAQLHRARRIAPPPAADAPLGVAPKYVLTSPTGRAEALRAVLDAVDPPSLVVVTASDVSAADATRALTRVGLVVDGLLVQVVRQPTSQHVALVVMWDAPASAEALIEALATSPVDAVALLAPEELPAFSRLSQGSATAWVAPERKRISNARVHRLRTTLRDALQQGGGATASELALLTPLLESFDAVEIAAATLRMYERALTDIATLKLAATQVVARPATGTRGLSVVEGGAKGSSAQGKLRVFLAVGKRDMVRVGDIVGAVANEAGIDGDRIGTVDMFESHSTVEMSADDAAIAVTALADVSLRGRKLSARIDERAVGGGERRPPRTFGPPREDRGPRSDSRSDSRGDSRGPRADSRGDSRGERPAFRGKPRPDGRSEGRPDSRGAPRSDSRGDARGGPPRAGSRDGGSRGTFGATEARRSFGDRSPSERTESTSEWAQRGERMKHAKRPARPSTERTTERTIERNDEA